MKAHQYNILEMARKELVNQKKVVAVCPCCDFVLKANTQNDKINAVAPAMLTLLTKLVDLKYLSEYSDQDGVTQEAKELIKQATE